MPRLPRTQWTNVNTAGTLTNVAYQNQANTFTVSQQPIHCRGTALSVTHNATIGDTLTLGTAGTTSGSLVLASAGSATKAVTLTFRYPSQQ